MNRKLFEPIILEPPKRRGTPVPPTKIQKDRKAQAKNLPAGRKSKHPERLRPE